MSETSCFFCGHVHLDPEGRYCARCGEFYDRSMRGARSHYGGALFNSIIFAMLILGFAFTSLLFAATSESGDPRLWPTAVGSAVALLPLAYAVRVLRLRPGSGVSRSKANTQSAMVGVGATVLALAFLATL